MIYDKLENLEMYKSVHPRFAKAIEWIKSQDLKSLPAQKGTEIDGKDIYFNVDEYTTGNYYKKSYEGHKEYIDFQIVLKGREVSEQSFVRGDEEEVRAYNPEGDNFKCHSNWDSQMYLEDGCFAIYFPHDLHKPCINVGGKPCEMKKVVVKVKLK